MKTIFLAAFIMISLFGFSQNKNFIDKPYLETSASVDTLVTPDKIFLSIVISESDSKDKVSVEELEQKMVNKLKSLDIDIEKQLKLNDFESNFEKNFNQVILSDCKSQVLPITYSLVGHLHT